MLKGLQHMHENDIVHRDIKLENLLLQSKRNLSSVKIADMGFATRLSSRGTFTSMAGTPAYLAPEMIKVITGRCGDVSPVRQLALIASRKASRAVCQLRAVPYPPDQTRVLICLLWGDT